MNGILEKYGIDETRILVEIVTTGMINRTWKIKDGDQQYILQRINDQVFKQPDRIGENTRMIDLYLKQNSPGYLFLSPIKTINGEELVFDEGKGWFRLFHFLQNSHSIQVATHPNQAFEAAYQFGKFTKLLSGFDASKLHITIPDFHNLSLRYLQFEDAVKHGNAQRIKGSKKLIEEIEKRKDIVKRFEEIKNNHLIKTRVTHHDTKISNVLFDEWDKGVCVIDLDTVMPGYFISDLGDMIRTYLSSVSEEEKDFDAIDIRDDYFHAIISGYAGAMGDELTKEERPFIFFSGLFMTYMQALRFLTDHLNNDVYYGAAYQDHNFVRAGNQIELLKKLEGRKEMFQRIINDHFPKHRDE